MTCTDCQFSYKSRVKESSGRKHRHLKARLVCGLVCVCECVSFCVQLHVHHLLQEQKQQHPESAALVPAEGASSSVATTCHPPACPVESQSIFDGEVNQTQEFPDTFPDTLAYEPPSDPTENEPKKDLSLKFDAAAQAAESAKIPVSDTAVVPATLAISLTGSSPKQDAAVVANATQKASGEQPASSGSKGKDMVIEIQDSLHGNMVRVEFVSSSCCSQSSQPFYFIVPYSPRLLAFPIHLASQGFSTCIMRT